MSTNLSTTTRKTRKTQTPAPALVELKTPALPAPDAQALKAAAEHAAWVEAMRVDWAAESGAGAFTGSFEDYLAKQAVDPKGQRYTGRMLALVQARKSYVKGANGNQHTGDFVGTLFQALPRPRVCEVCMALLGLDFNPYTHLNPGQQSMNLRNRVRGAMQRGEISVETIQAAVEAALAA